MNRILIIVLYALFIISSTQAQQVGIGTTQPDPSAALDIKSSNKGLLVPRVDLLASPIPAPATGLLVFNTNPGFYPGMGLYYNSGTNSAPQWAQLAPNTGSFINNQLNPQASSNFNISGQGFIGNTLSIGSTYSGYLPVLSLSNSITDRTSLEIRNTSSNAAWEMVVLGSDYPGVAGAWVLYNSSTATIPLLVKNGSVSINKFGTPTATLDVNGDIKAASTISTDENITAAGTVAANKFLIDMKYVTADYSIPANSRGRYIIACPGGYQVVSGGGGHRDWNSAAGDIRLSYNGPDPADPSHNWRLMVNNTGGSSRAITMYCNCAKVQ